MEHHRAIHALGAGELVAAVVLPDEQANGWRLFLESGDGMRSAYLTPGGAPALFHSLDRATEVARELGFETVRVEEPF